MSTEQPSRFDNPDSEMGLWQVGGKANSKSDSETFFVGPEADDRMKKFRESISYIRLAWDRYPQFMGELRDYVMRQREPQIVPGRESEWKEGPGLVETLLSSRKEWPELGDGENDVGYSAVRLYTSDYCYKKIFEPMNYSFREWNLAGKDLRALTFLVELLNIDLYRYIHVNSEANDFTGRTYRGMRITSKALAKIRETAADENLKNRYVAIPLSMMSTSRSRQSALKFAERTVGRDDPHAVLWDVTVYDMNPAYLAAYRKTFPDSIVTSMCAVPVNNLSYFRDIENEVLLRGPFFQIVRVYEDIFRDEPLHVIQAVTLNSNRDHVTAVATNEGEDERMRKIFRDMAISSRSARCTEHAERLGLTADASYYRNEAAQARARFSALM
jgi:hypothetical protein